MQQEHPKVVFNRDLLHYLKMSVEIWPTLNSALQHLSEVKAPYTNSLLPLRQYSSMQETNFIQTIVQDLFDFIMTHDVVEEDIEDYLDDILDLLMVDEQLVGGNRNPASIHNMAHFTMEVINQLQQDKRDKLDYFQQTVYQNVKLFKGQTINQQPKEEEEGEYQEGQSGEDDGDCQQQEQGQQAIVVEKSEQQLLRQKQLQDDGWVIVRK